MRNQTIVLDSGGVEEVFDEVPSTGDKIELNGNRYFIERVDIINNSKMKLLVVPDRSVKRYEDFADPSIDWSELPDKFLESDEDSDVDFTEEESLIKR